LASPPLVVSSAVPHQIGIVRWYISRSFGIGTQFSSDNRRERSHNY